MSVEVSQVARSRLGHRGGSEAIVTTMPETVTSLSVRETRRALCLSQSEFGKALWRITRGDSGRVLCPYTRSYISKLENGRARITPEIAWGVRALASRADGVDAIEAAARERNVLAINDLPAGTVVLGAARHCANPGCPVVFVPVHPMQRYHCRKCAAQARATRARG